MDSEHLQAVSFVNKFCVLADGLVPGIEKYLAKEVILNWFGKNIKGKHQVAFFIKNSRVSTSHLFKTIVPIDAIEYQTREFMKSASDAERNNNDPSEEMDNQLQSKNTSNCECTDFMPEVDKSKQISEEKASECELNEGDLNTLSSLDTSETKRDTNETKVEEMMSQFKNIKMKCGHRDDPELLEAKSSPSLKFVQAEGSLMCFENGRKKRGLYSNINYLPSQHTWKKYCKLEIAYSIGKQEQIQAGLTKEKRKKVSRISESRPSYLPTFEQVIALSNQLVPDDNHFGGYLRDYHFYSERKKFYQNVRSEMSKKEEGDGEDAAISQGMKRLKIDQQAFLFNYTIHYIGYELCKMDTSDC